MKPAIALLILLGGGAAAIPTVDTTHAVTTTAQTGTWDLDRLGVPPLISADYIESARIGRISFFRSSYGHDYSDELEHCRSMKHYFDAASVPNPATVAIFSPVNGQLVRVEAEQAFGTQLQIQPDAWPAFTVVLFHVVPDGTPRVGDRVTAGARLGHHVGSQTASDVAIRVETTTGSRLVSYFDALDDATWARYVSRGVASRSSFVHSRGARDADPLSCDASGTFASSGSLLQWVTLK